MLIVGRGVARLSRKLPRMPGKVAVVAHQHSATGSGDDLVSIEGKNPHSAEHTRMTIAIPGAECLGGILDQHDAISLAGRYQRREIGCLPVEMHDHYGLGQLA